MSKGGNLRFSKCVFYVLFAFFMPTLLCSTNAMANACYQLYRGCKEACLKSGTSDTPNDNFYYKCGGNDGCTEGAIVRILGNDSKSTYYSCDGTKWVPIQEHYLDTNADKIRDCGATGSYGWNSVYSGHTYEFVTGYPPDRDSIMQSDICKKVKQAKDTTKTTPESVEATVEAPAVVLEQKLETLAEKPVEPVTKAVSTPAQSKTITISGTVTDDNGGLPLVNIVVLDDKGKPVANTGTTTSPGGEFTLNVTGTGDTKIQFSYVGYKTIKKTVNEIQSNSNIKLEVGSNILNEVAITPGPVDENTDHALKPISVTEIPTATSETPRLETRKRNMPAMPGISDEYETPEELEEKLKTAKDALAAAREKENSLANRAVSATSTAATGLGAMEAASALAERNADEDAEAEMQEYISTMKCEYGNGQQFNLGPDEITLPGGNELFEYYTEYKTLANNLKTTKAALGLRPGIENEVLYDRAQSGLYQYSNAERQSGGETSLYRALTDTGGADAAAWNDQKDKTKTKLTAGGVTTAVGVVGGAAGNYFINRDKKEDTDKK